jgi:membrane-associated phospholipid phosphatase
MPIFMLIAMLLIKPMNDLIPNERNRFAVLIGRLLHPFVVSIVTLILMLQSLPVGESLTWVTAISVILIAPVMVFITLIQRQERYVYQRHERGTIYLIGWISVIVCLLLAILLQAPQVLTIGLLTLAFWVPLQRFINHRFTKVSAHAAVITACVVGLVLLGPLNTPLGWLFGVVVIVLTGWARVETTNHSPLQVLLGMIIGALPVLLIFPLAR